MIRVFVLMIVSVCLFFKSNAQVLDTISTSIDNKPSVSDEVYKMKYGLDIPLAVAGTAWTLYGFSKIYGRDRVPESEILALDPKDVNSFDRYATKKYNMKAKDLSDKFFYGSMPAPILLLLDKEIRRDGHKIGLLYLEAMAITGTIYTSASMLTSRFRPLAYNPEVGMGTRTRGGARNSFPAGHPGLVATSTFFMAKVYSDYHPNMRNKWMLYTAAGAASLATGILRIEGGQHFPTDVITGLTLGTLSGILVPHFHKNKKFKNLSILPYKMGDANGLTALIRL